MTDLPAIRTMLNTLGHVLSEGIEKIHGRECAIVVVCHPRPIEGQNPETSVYCHGASANIYAMALRVSLESMKRYLTPEVIAELEQVAASVQGQTEEVL